MLELTSARRDAADEERQHLLGLPTYSLQFGTRPATVFAREGLTHVEQVVALGEPGLLALRGFGSGTIETIDRVLREQRPYEGLQDLHEWLTARNLPRSKVARHGQSSLASVIDVAGSLSVQSLFRDLAARFLNSREASIVLARSGCDGSKQHLQEVGDRFGITRERIRQLEKLAVAKLLLVPAWLDRIGHALKAAASRAGYILGSDLAADPWLAPLAENRGLAAFICRHFFAQTWACSQWSDEDFVLARPRDVPPLEVLQVIRRKLLAFTWPAPLKIYDAIVASTAKNYDSTDLVPLLAEALSSEAIFDDPMQPAVVYGFGYTFGAGARAMLAESDGPVRIAELFEIYGRMALPEGAIYCGRGRITFPDKLPGFDRWERMLLPRVHALMSTKPAGFQWLADGLLEQLAGAMAFPDWMTPDALAAMMRRSGAFDDLRRRRFAIKGSTPGRRIHYMPLVIKLLEEHGEPMYNYELETRMAEQTQVPRLFLLQYTSKPPLFLGSDGRVGLVPRDIPGGTRALKAAEATLVAALHGRRKTIPIYDALHIVQSQSKTLAIWDREVLRAMCRWSNNLHLGVADLTLVPEE